MAIPSYTTDLTDIELAVTAWGELTGATAGLASAIETDWFLEGTSCVSKPFATAGLGSMAYNKNSIISIPSGHATFHWIFFGGPNAIATLASGGYRIAIGNTVANYKMWYVLGSDTYAYGGWQNIVVDPTVTADAQKFQLISSNNTTVDPPNTVTCQVSSLVTGYNVGMYMTDVNGVIETTTYTLDGIHEAAATTVLVTATISGNWSGQRPPPAGYLRVVLVNGTEVLKKYTSWVTKTFTLVGTLGTQCASGSKVYIPIIDEVCSGATITNTLIKAATIYIKVRVRHYASPPNGIIPFEQDTQVGITGVDVPAIKVIDSIVN